MKLQTLFEIYDEEHPSKKVCNRCGQEYDVSEFGKNKRYKDGIQNQCKNCLIEKRERNKVNQKICAKRWYENNKEHLKEEAKERGKAYYEKNKESIKEYEKEYREKNKEKICERKKTYFKNNAERIKENRKKNKVARDNHRLKKTYNITENQRRQMIKDQDGCCAICGKPQIELAKKLFVDHNHVTGNVRGLLCSKCNFILGLVNDSLEYLQKSIDYLNKYK